MDLSVFFSHSFFCAPNSGRVKSGIFRTHRVYTSQKLDARSIRRGMGALHISNVFSPPLSILSEYVINETENNSGILIEFN